MPLFRDIAGSDVLRLPLPTPTLPPATTTNTVIVCGEKLAVIEPATPHSEAEAELERVIADQVTQGRSLMAIVLTHHHPDHIAAAPVLRSRFGAPIMAHPLTAQRLPFPVDGHLDDGQALDLGGTILRALWTPGHAPGHLVIADLHARWAYAGDLVAGQGTIVIDPEDGGDMAAYLRSLARLRELELEVLVPSHGEPIRDVDPFIAQLVAHREAREDKVIAALRDGIVSEGPLLERVYAGTPTGLMPWAARSLRAHLNKLVAEQRVEEREGRLRLSPPA